MHSTFIDLTNKRFGKYLVKELAPKRKNITYWLCYCDCGNKKEVRGTDLRSKRVVSCGCSRIPDILGKKFGKLMVIKLTNKIKFGEKVWLCKCDCGGSKEVVSGSLKQGLVKSCGCIRKVKNKNNGILYKIPEDLIGKKFGKLKVIKLKKKVKRTGKRISFIMSCYCSHCNKNVEKDAYAIAKGNALDCRISNKLSDKKIFQFLRKIIKENKPE